MTTTTNTTHVLIVPGSFCPPRPLYNKLLSALQSRGISASTMHLPSVQPISPRSLRNPTPASMYDDASAIAAEVQRLTLLLRPASPSATNPWRGITVLAHSYGGIPLSQAFSHSAIPATSVRHLIYLAAVVPPLNQGLMMPGFSVVPPGVTIEEDGYMVHEDPEASAPRVWSSLSPEQAVEEARGQFAAHSARSFTDFLTHPGWRDVLTQGDEGRSVTYVRCTEDRTVPPQGQADMVDAMNQVVEELGGEADGEGEKVVAKTEKRVQIVDLRADHMPISSAPEELADIVARIAAA